MYNYDKIIFTTMFVYMRIVNEGEAKIFNAQLLRHIKYCNKNSLEFSVPKIFSSLFKSEAKIYRQNIVRSNTSQ